MAKGLRSKRKKRLRTLRREIVQPLYDAKETAKIAAQNKALAAPKIPVRGPRIDPNNLLEATPSTAAIMDVDMADGGTSNIDTSFLKPGGGIGKKKLKKKLKKGKHHGKAVRKVSKKHNI